MGKKKERNAIRITCQGADWLAPGQLANFQGKLKGLTEKEYQKLKRSIEESGFSFPIFVWKGEGKNNIIDGHQRLLVVVRMLKEGYTIEGGKLPVDWIEAKDRTEAKGKILLAMSQYGKYTERSLMSFVEEASLDLEQLQFTIDVPEVDIEKYLSDLKKENAEPEVEFSEELLEEHNYVVLYFDNEVDWLQAQTLLDLKPVRALHTKKGFMTQGIGRVIEGAEAIERIRQKAE
jgi:ParB-like chromosome segregation protein Spo0J